MRLKQKRHPESKGLAHASASNQDNIPVTLENCLCYLDLPKTWPDTKDLFSLVLNIWEWRNWWCWLILGAPCSFNEDWAQPWHIQNCCKTSCKVRSRRQRDMTYVDSVFLIWDIKIFWQSAVTCHCGCLYLQVFCARPYWVVERINVTDFQKFSLVIQIRLDIATTTTGDHFQPWSKA